jgi:hypothetical protein
MGRQVGLVLASILVAACQGAGTPTAAPTTAATAPPATASPATRAPATATPAPTKPLVLPRKTDVALDGTCESEDQGCLGLLMAGKVYTTTTFKPTVSFSVPTAEWDNPNEAGGEMPLFSTRDIGDVIFFFSYARSTDPTVGYTVDAISTWLQGYAKVTVTPAVPASIGGLHGVTMDIRVAPGVVSTDPQCPVQACVPLFRGDDPDATDPYQWHWDWGVAGTEAMRVYLLDANKVVVLLLADSVDGLTFDTISGAFDAMAPTIKFATAGA